MKTLRYAIFIILAFAAAIITNSCGGSASLPGTGNDLPPDPGNEQSADPGGNPEGGGELPNDIDNDGIPDSEDPDADGDGFTVDDGDCNDLDPDTYPGAPDQPDYPGYIDTNCDGIDGDLLGAYWVSTDGNDANPGTIDEPFATIQKGIDSAAVDPSAVLDVYVVGGNYNQDGILSTGVGLYGGFGPLDGGLRQRDIELYESVNTIKTTSFWIAGPSDSVIEGMTFKGIADTVTILIVNTSPTLRHNKIYSAESHINSIAVGVLAIGDDAATKPNFLANLIVADDIDPLEASGVSIGIYAFSSGNNAEVYPTLEDNNILSGFGVDASIGVSLYAGSEVAKASLDAFENTIEAGESDNRTAGILLGLEPIEDASQQFTKANISNNRIFGGSNSWLSFSIYARAASDEVNIKNNFVTGGENIAGNSVGIYFYWITGNILNNSINAGSSISNTVGIVLDQNGGPLVDIMNNTLYSEDAAKSYGIGEISQSGTPYALQNNLFDSTLDVYYHDAPLGDLADISLVDGLGDIIAVNDNIAGNSSFADVSSRDYHILDDSDAVDNGVWLESVEDDIDGEERPETGFDIGADELD